MYRFYKGLEFVLICKAIRPWTKDERPWTKDEGLWTKDERPWTKDERPWTIVNWQLTNVQ